MILHFFAAVLGAVVGSFLNVVILRLPVGESIVFPGSRCPRCEAAIAWYDNIPVLSYLVLRGRCRHCRAAISGQYPLVEALMALLSWGLFVRFGIGAAFVVYFVFAAALLAVIFIDFHHQIIPDVISLPGIVLGVGAAFVNPYVTWQDALIGVAAGGGIFYAVAGGYYLVTKRAGMGGGDIKLLAMIGAFLGWQAVPFVIFASALTGTVVGVWAMARQGKGGKTVVPYGPFLSLAAYGYLFFREEIWYAVRVYYLLPMQQ